MDDICAACGREIFTTTNYAWIGAPDMWTHGGYGVVDRLHHAIPSNHEYQITRVRRG